MNLPEILLLHDWLMKYAGSERVVEQIIKTVPVKEIRTLFHSGSLRLDTNQVPVSASFLNKLPGVGAYYRQLLPFYPLAVNSIDAGEYKIILSSSHSLIKCVKKGHGQLHICYCYTPPRYLYDFRDLYFSKAIQLAINPILDQLAKWDVERSASVDYFIGISEYIRERIKRVYNKNAAVIYPPCQTDFGPYEAKENFFLTASRLVPYKRVDLLVKTFNRLKLPLVVVGDGPQLGYIRSIAQSNVKVMGWVGHDELIKLMKKARAFVFASEEDFGIVCVEAQACGTPVVCCKRGGQAETVIDWKHDCGRATGLFFDEQTEDSLASCVEQFQKIAGDLKSSNFATNISRFAPDIFRRHLRAFVEKSWKKHSSNGWVACEWG